MSFVEHVKSLVEVIEEMGNPFLEKSNDLFRIIDNVVCSFRKAKYQTVMADRLLLE